MNPDREENAPKRPHWFGWIIALVAGCTMLGVFYIGWKIM